jgi:hypothetical protein
VEQTPNHCRVSSYTRNLKHVDRFSLKQLNKPCVRGVQQSRKRICKYVVPPVAEYIGESKREKQPPATHGTNVGQLAKVHTAHCHCCPVCRRMKIYSCRCCLLHTFTMLWECVCVAAACEDSRLGTVPMVERVDGAILQAARVVQVWKLSSGMFGMSPGTGTGATLWLEMLYYCQSEETMGGMRWLSRCVR